jgi:hypothetical protein
MISGETLYNSERFIDLQGILSQTPIVMLDHQRRNAIDGFEQNTEAGKRLHELAGWDKHIPESTPQYQLGAPVFRLASMPAPEVRLWATAGFACGIQPWWHHIGANHEDRRQYKTAQPIFEWHEANQDILVNRILTPDVGVVWSQQNQDYFGRANAPEKTMGPYRGVVKALDRHAIPYVPLHADDIATAYDRFQCIILPNVGALSDEQVGHVKSFIAKGGSVIATGETSSATLYGDQRDQPALAKLFGIKRASGQFGATGPISPDIETWTRHTYLRLAPENRTAAYGPSDKTAPTETHPRNPVLRGLEETDTIPFGGLLPVMDVEEGTEVLATFIPEFPIFPPETSWMREPNSSIPAITARSAPEGGKLIWLIADIDRCFARDASPEHALIIANAVDYALGGKRKVAISGGHGMITAELYRQDDRQILHLNNRLLLSGVPGRQYDLVPVGPVQVEIACDAPDKSVDLRVANKTVKGTVENGLLRFTVDSILDHEVIVIH